MTQKPVFLEGIFTLRNLRSMGAAAIIEMAIACGVAGVLLWQQLRPIAAPPPLTDPNRIVEFSPSIPVLPHIVPTSRQPAAPRLSEVPPVRESIPSPTAVPMQPPLPPQTPAQPSRSPVSLAAEFSARMLRAINDQKVYPRGPLLQGVTGETVVSFDYVGGAVSNIHVDKSSGSPELDEAAVQAVQRAVLPPKPAELVNVTRFVFHLEFDLGG